MNSFVLNSAALFTQSQFARQNSPNPVPDGKYRRLKQRLPPLQRFKRDDPDWDGE
jgi:hypothetical protein